MSTNSIILVLLKILVKFQHISKTRYVKKSLMIICMDETSLKSFTVHKKGPLRIGVCCILKTSNSQVFKKYTGVFAMPSSKIRGYKI